MTDPAPTRHETATRWPVLDFAQVLNRLLLAVQDCRREGVNPMEDATVCLIADGLGQIANVAAEDRFDLIRACQEAAQSFRTQPLLMQIFSQKIAYDDAWKPGLRKEAKLILRSLAIHLKLRSEGYGTRSNRGGPAVFGEVIAVRNADS